MNGGNLKTRGRELWPGTEEAGLRAFFWDSFAQRKCRCALTMRFFAGLGILAGTESSRRDVAVIL